MAIIFLGDCCSCGRPIFADKIDMSEKATYSGTNWEADRHLCVECYMKVYGISVEDRKNARNAPIDSDKLLSYLGKRLAAHDSEVKKLRLDLAKARMRWWKDCFNTCYDHYLYETHTKKSWHEYRDQWERIASQMEERYNKLEDEFYENV